MRTSSVTRLVHLASVIGLAGLLLALCLMVMAPARADAGIRYVAPDGDDSKLCDSIANRCRTVQRAIDVADPFDEIRVATGTYTDAAGTVAEIIKTVTLLGGWDGGFTTRDPAAYPTTLDAQRNGRVVYISGNISPTIDGFVITGGNANDQGGVGGGILSLDASPVIQNNVIISNVASISPTTGSGGGIYLEGASASALISGNLVLSNTATIDTRGNGGGLYLSFSEATVCGNVIRGNVAGTDGGHGGGLFLQQFNGTVRDNLIQGNVARSYGYYDSHGGGMRVFYGSPRILDNEIRDNSSVHNGGGIDVNGGTPLIQGNRIVGNAAGPGWNGGGLLVEYGSPTITANRILSNTAGSSGGLGLETSDYFTVTNNVIAHNNDGGIRLWEFTRYGLIVHNTIVSNGGEGGIRLAYGYITPTIVNNIIVSNTYGISAHADASGTLDYNDVWGNTTQDYDLPGALEPSPNDIQADPLFVDPANDDYHLRAGSPCIDTGTDAGVTTDIDDDPRPMGARVDIGADEYRRYTIYLPLVMKS